MLQQTQVPRVLARWGAWLDRFPSVQALPGARGRRARGVAGNGYNRRALALKGAAEAIVAEYDGEIPQDTRQLCALPGIGPATAQGIRSFAFDLPACT